MANTAVFAILSDRLHAQAAVDALLRNGFRGEDISVLLADNKRESARAEWPVESSARSSEWVFPNMRHGAMRA
jgi:hypothetical protein